MSSASEHFPLYRVGSQNTSDAQYNHNKNLTGATPCAIFNSKLRLLSLHHAETSAASRPRKPQLTNSHHYRQSRTVRQHVVPVEHFFSACASQRNERTRLSFPPCFVFSPFYSVLVVILLVHVQPAAGAYVVGFSHRHHRCDRVAEWRIITSRVPGFIHREDSRLVYVTLRSSSREPPVFRIFLQVARGRRLIITTCNSNRYYFWTSAASRVTHVLPHGILVCRSPPHVILSVTR
jgi:hypothetical protein